MILTIIQSLEFCPNCHKPVIFYVEINPLLKSVVTIGNFSYKICDKTRVMSGMDDCKDRYTPYP
jgi:hypothetical protein